MKEIDIAAFAESLLTERIESGKPVQFAAEQSPDAPDVSDVEVSHDFTSQILNEGYWDKADIKVIVPTRRVLRKRPVELTKSSDLSEEVQVRKQLFGEYRNKLKELDEIVQEMTTVGMLGVGSGAVVASGMTVSSKKKKKKHANARTRRFNR